MTQPLAQQKQVIRKQMRQLRRSLTEQMQRQAAQNLLLQLQQQPFFQQAQCLAVYLAQDGELSMEPLIHYGWKINKQMFLPVCRPFNQAQLWFSKFHPNTRLKANKFTIPEPESPLNSLIKVSLLDIVFFPLVAFDLNGARLGMGGGFYDSTFAHLREQKQRPLFIGVAHNDQCHQQLPNEEWDLPLDAVATPNQLHCFNSERIFG